MQSLKKNHTKLWEKLITQPDKGERDNLAIIQGSKLTVASCKFASSKSHLPPVKNVGRKKLLPGNSVLKAISWKNKPIFTEISLLFIRQTQFHMVKGIISAFDHMEFCLVKLTMCGNLALHGHQ